MRELNILDVRYSTTGKSRETDEKGMLEMQARAFQQKDAQYLLLKSPPASGKSRALMFLALDKIYRQGLAKVIVAVPEMSIGRSFRSTDLVEHGFHADWHVEPYYNLCMQGGETGKVKTFIRFINDPDATTLICTHATLRFAFERLSPSDFDGIVLGVDEFHHSSASEGNRLGTIIDALIEGSTAHIIAMTGSYFRGDAVPIMLPKYEALFTQVTYSYYEQLNGYQHLKSLGINYFFYQNSYLSAISEVLDTDLKTIIHIPNVNSIESTKKKYDEVDAILDVIGTVIGRDDDTGILHVQREDGKVLKVADLVTDTKQRALTQAYLDTISDREDLDIIIALGMAKEGFDWVWCEHVLTIGYRSSLTEIVQIIGRATRDAEGKTHAQFTNLITQPNAEDEDVDRSVNNLLKAISISLLMQQVLTPNVNFKPRSRATEADKADLNTVLIDDSTAPLSDTAMLALSNQDTIKARLIQDSRDTIAPVMTGEVDITTLIDYEIPKIISDMYPSLSADELALVSQKIHESMVHSANGGFYNESDLPANAEFWEDDSEVKDAIEQKDKDATPKPSVEFDDEPLPISPSPSATKDLRGATNQERKFALIDNKFIDVDHLDIPLIKDRIRSTDPFEGSYNVISRTLDSSALRAIESYVAGKRSDMTETEAVHLYPRIKAFISEYGRNPHTNHSDHHENRLAIALALIKERQRERMQKQQDDLR